MSLEIFKKDKKLWSIPHERIFAFSLIIFFKKKTLTLKTRSRYYYIPTRNDNQIFCIIISQVSVWITIRLKLYSKTAWVKKMTMAKSNIPVSIFDPSSQYLKNICTFSYIRDFISHSLFICLVNNFVNIFYLFINFMTIIFHIYMLSNRYPSKSLCVTYVS